MTTNNTTPETQLNYDKLVAKQLLDVCLPFVAQVERAMCSMYHDTKAMRLRPTMDAFFMELFQTLSQHS